jgi:CRISPR-associated protein Cmr6
MKPNAGFLFTKDYFKFNQSDYIISFENEKIKIEKREHGKNIDITSDFYKKKNKKLYSITLDKDFISFATKPYDEISNDHKFDLTTVYPGLLIGSGYMHDIKNDDAFKLGFYFDHTTGLPVIPGSSVKGVLRSAFKKSHEYIKSLLGNDKINIKDLENNIFVGKDANGNDLPMSKRDTFLDAFPVASSNAGGKIFADDYITPHKEPLKNPVPLKFLKILPGVTFTFYFKLHDFTDQNGKTITADQKRTLFKKILLDFGVGAKTNVGYGQFSDNIDNNDGYKTEEIKLIDLNNINKNDIIDCLISEIIYREKEKKFQVYLKPLVKDYDNLLMSLGKKNPSIKLASFEVKNLEENQKVKCKVSRVGDDKRIFFENKIINNA